MEADCYRGSSRQPLLSGPKSLVAIDLEFLVFSNFHMILLLESVFHFPSLTPVETDCS